MDKKHLTTITVAHMQERVWLGGTVLLGNVSANTVLEQ